MDNLPKELMVMLALEMNMNDLANLCLVNKHWNRNVCENDVFWMKKLQNDYPWLKKNPQVTYKEYFRVLFDKDFPGFISPRGLSSADDLQFQNRLAGNGLISVSDHSKNKIKARTFTGFDNPMYLQSEFVEFLKIGNFGDVPPEYGISSFQDVLAPLLKDGILSIKLLIQLFFLYFERHNLISTVPKLSYRTDDIMHRILYKQLAGINRESFTYPQIAPILTKSAVKDKKRPSQLLPQNELDRIEGILYNLHKIHFQ